VRIYEEKGPEHLWEDQQRVVTPEDLAGWVASLIDEDVAVREMVESWSRNTPRPSPFLPTSNRRRWPGKRRGETGPE
jgi:hypothetical protein